MSREIKFRAWDEEEKEYYYNAEHTYDFLCSGRGCCAESFGDVLDHPKWFVVEQYTGLKDKNGKEIYEGDIIHRGALSKANVFRNSVIRFDEKSVGFIATSTRNGARTLFNSHTCDEIEVIGNIHENPELLEEKND